MLFQNAGPMITLRVGLVLRMTASASAMQCVPFRVHLAVRLVEDFEHHVRWRVPVVLRHLRPERQHLPAAALGVLAAAFVVVLVEDDVEVLLHRLADQPIEGGEPARRSSSLSFIWRKPYRLMRTVSKPPSLMILKCRGLKRAFDGVLPDRVVAHDVHAALHLRDLVGGGKRLRGRGKCRQGEQAGRVSSADHAVVPGFRLRDEDAYRRADQCRPPWRCRREAVVFTAAPGGAQSTPRACAISAHCQRRWLRPARCSPVPHE